MLNMRGEDMEDPRLQKIHSFLKQCTASEWEDAWVVETAENLISILHNPVVLKSIVKYVAPGAHHLELTTFENKVKVLVDACTAIGVPSNFLFSARDINAGSATTRQAFERVVYSLHELATRHQRVAQISRQESSTSTSAPVKPLFKHSLAPAASGARQSAQDSTITNRMENLNNPNSTPSKGLLELLLGDEFPASATPSPGFVPRTNSGREDNPNSSKRNDKAIAMFRRARENMDAIASSFDSPQSTMGTDNEETLRSTLTQASVARVQERIAESFKRKCQELEEENQSLLSKLKDLEQSLDDKTQEQTALTESLSHVEAQRLELKSNHEFWLSELTKLENFLGIAAEQNSLQDSKASIRLLTNHALELKRSVESMMQGNFGVFRQRGNSNASYSRDRVTTLSDDEDENLIEHSENHTDHSVQVQPSGKASFAEKLPGIQQEICTLKEALSELSSQTKSEMMEIGQRLLETTSKWQGKLTRMTSLYQKEATRRKQLLNQVHHLKGNIRVVCRIRPRLPHEEAAENSEVVVRRLSSDKVVVVPPGQKGGKVPRMRRYSMAPRGSKAAEAVGATGGQKEYEFDEVFGPESTQSQVFDEVRPLVESVLDGYSSSIFAYGQTGSGKTYTMSGAPQGEHQGVNYRALDELFDLVDRRSSAKFSYKISISIVEIYNEQVRDLIAPSARKESANLTIREGPEGIFIPECTVTGVTDVEQVWEVMNLSQENRVSASTNMNDKSSRSHSVVMISVDGLHEPSGNRTRGKLILVDLAGSERLDKSGVVEQQKKEAQHINKSLSSLGDVIAALTNPKAAHVPFRNSKLTYLLKDALGKDNKALMVIQVSPISSNAQESNCSMQFGARVRTVRLGRPQRKEESGIATRIEAQLRKAEAAITTRDVEIAALRVQVDDLRSCQEKTLSRLRETTGTLQAMNGMELDLKKQLEKERGSIIESQEQMQRKVAQLKSEYEAKQDEAFKRQTAQLESFKNELKEKAKLQLESQRAELSRKHQQDKEAYNMTIQSLENKLTAVRQELQKRDSVKMENNTQDTRSEIAAVEEKLKKEFEKQLMASSMSYSKQIASLEAKLTSSKMELNSRARQAKNLESAEEIEKKYKKMFEESRSQWVSEQTAQEIAFNKRIANMEAKLQSARLELIAVKKGSEVQHPLESPTDLEGDNITNSLESPNENLRGRENISKSNAPQRKASTDSRLSQSSVRSKHTKMENELKASETGSNPAVKTSHPRLAEPNGRHASRKFLAQAESTTHDNRTQNRNSKSSVQQQSQDGRKAKQSSLRPAVDVNETPKPRTSRQVTWKNTPQFISPAHSIPGTPDSDSNDLVENIHKATSQRAKSKLYTVSKSATPHSFRSKPKNPNRAGFQHSVDPPATGDAQQNLHQPVQMKQAKKALGGASRILQPTPSRSNVRAPRRIPTSSRRPKWNPS